MTRAKAGVYEPTPRKTVPKPRQGYDKVFVNVRPDEGSKKLVSEYLENMVPSASISRFLQAGNRVSLVYEPDNDCFAARAFKVDDDDEQAGFILAARAGDAEHALAALLWADTEQMQGEWGNFAAEQLPLF